MALMQANGSAEPSRPGGAQAVPFPRTGGEIPHPRA
jgi:hypothetical protein